MTTLEVDDLLKPGTPLKVFEQWFKDAQKSTMKHPEAFVLSTLGESQVVPNSRVVLMKEITADGIIFYTNYESQKGHELKNSPHASALFYWDPLFQQVKLIGDVSKVPQAQSDAYWQTRPRTSQISQWVSQQSQPVNDRKTMEAQYRIAEEKFSDKMIPRPPHWGGYLLSPTYVEFWIGREGRFHDRYTYRKVENKWIGQRLYP